MIGLKRNGQIVKKCENPIEAIKNFNAISDFIVEVNDGDEKSLNMAELIRRAIEHVKRNISFDVIAYDNINDNIHVEDKKVVVSDGHHSMITSSVFSPIIATCGRKAKIAVVSKAAKVFSVGYNPDISISGISPVVFVEGNFARVAISSDYGNVMSKSENALINSCGYNTQVYNHGKSARISLNGECSCVENYATDVIITCTGKRSKVKGCLGTKIYLAGYNGEQITHFIIDGKFYKENVWYVNVRGNIMEY